MTTKWLKPNNGKLSNIIKESADQQKAIAFSVSKLSIETGEAQLESCLNSELKTNSDHKKQVSKKAMYSKIISLLI